MTEKIQDKQLVLGLMSGTSLDGLDMALCEFDQIDGKYAYRLIAARTTGYTEAWKKRLSEAGGLGAEAYFGLHASYGKFLAEEANAFIRETGQNPDLISSHGHTVFHRPESGFTTQLGCGATLAANTRCTVVCDLRSLDVALEGQGAPLVPVGDKLLFGNYPACLNIGGIANISFDVSGERLAYDICEANMLLNFLAERTGKAYDAGGAMARSGNVDATLLATLGKQSYYSQSGAKSLGREWFEQHVAPHFGPNKPVNDLLATATEHISTVLANELNQRRISELLISGGGALNTYLLERLRAKTKCTIILPATEIIQFKEALIFAFLGYLRMRKQINTLKSVTGAAANSIGGAVYLGYA